jgi:pimeloyl-ACP methyl ester carboxylesterase
LIFGAERDPLYPEPLMRQVHETLGNSEYVRLPGASHVCLLELGPVVAARVRRFLMERRSEQAGQ